MICKNIYYERDLKIIDNIHKNFQHQIKDDKELQQLINNENVMWITKILKIDKCNLKIQDAIDVFIQSCALGRSDVVIWLFELFKSGLVIYIESTLLILNH